MAENKFFPLRIVAIVLLVMLIISFWVSWYTEEVSLSRYCAEPQQTLDHLQDVLQNPRPAGDGSRFKHLVAAKLIYIIPRHSEESVADYLTRVQIRLTRHCR
ncbi:MAG: hypothetical protein L3J70_11640 [Gammaproteobacteria bacterium]|nr:hypothetical protein [Gammaproteobacteria bacterium]